MECEECGTPEALQVSVEFESGMTDSLHLCDDCLDEFQEGSFVTDVVHH